MPKNTPKVFIDANILIGAGKPPGGPELARVVDLVEAGLVTVLTTDLTITEVTKKHAQNDLDLIKDITQPHFRKVVEAATGTKLPDLKKAELKQTLTNTYDASTKAMFEKLQAKTLNIDSVKPSTVFNTYADGVGFFSGEGKKDQFPDAFAFECLKQEASEAAPVIIVSQDKDFVKPVEAEAHITLVNSLPSLFATLGLEMEDPDIAAFLEEHQDELVEAVDSELSDWYLQGDVEDSEVYDTMVAAVEVQKLTAFKPTEKGDPILVVARLTVLGSASYSHPNWDTASYDSEDKVLVPWESVSGETALELNIDVSMSIGVSEEGEPQQLEELRFRNDDFDNVVLRPEGWPYK